MQTRRSKSIDIAPYNPEPERTLRKVRGEIKQNQALVSVPSSSSPPNLGSIEEEKPQGDMADNRTLRELVTPNTDLLEMCPKTNHMMILYGHFTC